MATHFQEIVTIDLKHRVGKTSTWLIYLSQIVQQDLNAIHIAHAASPLKIQRDFNESYSTIFEQTWN